MRSMRMLVMLIVSMATSEMLLHSAAEMKQREPDTCRSVGAMKFDPTQRPMQRSQGLEVCGKYKKNTCCNATHAHPLRLKIMEPVAAQFNRKCQQLTEEMICSACHPFVGTYQVKTICPRLCDDWYSACKSEYYSYGSSGSLTPCFGNALVCSPLSGIADSGADFCSKMGFHVGSDVDTEGDECFDGSVPLQVGEAEPTEPWQDKLRRLFEEQTEDPSGLFIALLFAPFVAMYFGSRFFRQLGDPFSSGQLSLEEVRRLQQEAYARGEGLPEVVSDSSSDDEHHYHPMFRPPQQTQEPQASQNASPSSSSTS